MGGSDWPATVFPLLVLGNFYRRRIEQLTGMTLDELDEANCQRVMT